MRWVLLISLLSLIEFYAFQAVKTVIKSKPFHWGYLLVSVVLLCYVLFVFYSYDRSIGPTKSTLRAGGMLLVVLVPKLVIVVFLLGEDIIRGVVAVGTYLINFFAEKRSVDYLPGRRKFVSQIALGIAAIPLIGFLHGIFKGKYNFKVLKYTLYFDDLPDAFHGFRVAQISDIHSGSFDDEKKIAYAVELINEQEMDVLFFTGDIVNTMAKEMDPWISVFKNIKIPAYGKYSILGNHDYGEYVSWETKEAKAANFEAIKNIHDQIDFKLLLNESVFLEKGEDKIAVIGVENWGHNFKQAGDLKKASEKVNADDFKILLSHDPSHWEHEVKKHQEHYHLTLSGHTHGFQFGIEIPGFMKWSPVQYVYKQWAGMYQEYGRYLNVNRGFGFHAFPGRVGIWPEISIIELRKKGETS
ncbi:metallophosphoesterase [Aquimarina sp. TRL1]|uniref:metallophosphoesterase n=1 Tax=Aquimarina sp. (strain TRL1) TaxID=2736252 RepID=UPI00158DB879|nr:metallophosphoesterase [Aquimarina sp. TRL1]QKX05132.1 metallophosphoesterase [Aquimarina sp. TRL1]